MERFFRHQLEFSKTTVVSLLVLRLNYVVFAFVTMTHRALTIPSNIRGYQSVRGLLDRIKSEEHLQSSNGSKKTKTNKNDKRKGAIIQSTCQKNIEDGHSIKRVWSSASREPSDTLPGSQP